jgi:hypothetical protein
MKTWKKIEETKKRTTDIHGLKKRNEEKVQKVSIYHIHSCIFDYENTENYRHPIHLGVAEAELAAELHNTEAAPGGETQNSGSHLPFQEGGGEADQDFEVAE